MRWTPFKDFYKVDKDLGALFSTLFFWRGYVPAMDRVHSR